MVLEPISVALKFGFLAVLYLFLLWVARSALRDLRRTDEARAAAPGPPPPDATGIYAASRGLGGDAPGVVGRPLLRVERAVGLTPGTAYDLSEELIMGRGGGVDLQLQDTFASSRHCRIAPQGSVLVVEDLGSTNGTFLNGEPLHGPQPLHPGDRIRIGDTEFSFEQS